MQTIKLLGNECRLQFEYYGNHTIAMSAILPENGELWLVATVNYQRFFQGKNYALTCGFPVVVIKNYDTNAGVYQQLLEQHVISHGAYLSGSQQTVIAAQLTPEWQRIAQTQLADGKNKQRGFRI